MRPITAVLFDLDHTLFDTDRTERLALKVVARAAGLPLGPRALAAYQAVNNYVWGEYRAGRVTSKELRVLRFHLWLKRSGRDPAPAARLAPLYLREFSSRGDLIAGAGATLRSLVRARMLLGAVTNGIDLVQRRRLKASELLSMFSVVVTSERAGITKPDPGIIAIALKRLKVSAGEAIYVGDDALVDGPAANGARVPFVWFNPRRTPPPKVPVVIDHQISRLDEILGLIRGR